MTPTFIPAGLAASPPTFVWWGRDEHTGSTRFPTPLLRRMDLKTSNGFITLCAGTVMWGAYRLQGRDEHVRTALQLAEAAFAYQVDWRYVDRDAVDLRITSGVSPTSGALLELCSFLWRCLDHEKYWENYYSPILETFHAAHLARHMLPRDVRPAFGRWVEEIIARLNIFAKKPDEAVAHAEDFPTVEDWKRFAAGHRGRPLPPEFLDGAQPTMLLAAEPQQCMDRAVDRHLRQLDWTGNPFLRTPDEMRALGFVGEPYVYEQGEAP